MANFLDVAKQFVDFYYKTFDQDRASLISLYREHSMLTFETNQVRGSADIVEKLQGLPFQKIQHQVATCDAQPANESGNILVLVTGALLTDDESKPQSYVQTFQLAPEAGSYYVFNDMFKLVYAG